MGVEVPPPRVEREYMCNFWIFCQWSSFMPKYGNFENRPNYINEPKYYTGTFDLFIRGHFVTIVSKRPVTRK